MLQLVFTHEKQLDIVSRFIFCSASATSRGAKASKQDALKVAVVKSQIITGRLDICGRSFTPRDKNGLQLRGLHGVQG